MIGNIFGRLTVIEKGKMGNQQMWICQCECGRRAEIRQWSLKVGRTTSCGCLKADQLAARNSRHGMSDSAENRTWNGMKQRCLNPNDKAYKRYGGRGIKVCDRWKNSFENFLEDMGKRPPGTSLDRIDNNGDYEPDNCRWATLRQQNNNTRNNRFITYKGVSKTVSEWAREKGIHPLTLRNRIFEFNYTPEEAFEKPVRKTYDHKKRALSIRNASK